MACSISGFKVRCQIDCESERSRTKFEKKREKILVEKNFRVCYILGGLREQAEKSEDLRKHGHSNLKAPPNATASRQS